MITRTEKLNQELGQLIHLRAVTQSYIYLVNPRAENPHQRRDDIIQLVTEFSVELAYPIHQYPDSQPFSAPEFTIKELWERILQCNVRGLIEQEQQSQALWEEFRAKFQQLPFLNMQPVNEGLQNGILAQYRNLHVVVTQLSAEFNMHMSMLEKQRWEERQLLVDIFREIAALIQYAVLLSFCECFMAPREASLQQEQVLMHYGFGYYYAEKRVDLDVMLTAINAFANRTIGTQKLSDAIIVARTLLLEEDGLESEYQKWQEKQDELQKDGRPILPNLEPKPKTDRIGKVVDEMLVIINEADIAARFKKSDLSVTPQNTIADVYMATRQLAKLLTPRAYHRNRQKLVIYAQEIAALAKSIGTLIVRAPWQHVEAKAKIYEPYIKIIDELVSAGISIESVGSSARGAHFQNAITLTPHTETLKTSLQWLLGMSDDDSSDILKSVRTMQQLIEHFNVGEPLYQSRRHATKSSEKTRVSARKRKILKTPRFSSVSDASSSSLSTSTSDGAEENDENNVADEDDHEIRINKHTHPRRRRHIVISEDEGDVQQDVMDEDVLGRAEASTNDLLSAEMKIDKELIMDREGSPLPPMRVMKRLRKMDAAADHVQEGMPSNDAAESDANAQLSTHLRAFRQWIGELDAMDSDEDAVVDRKPEPAKTISQTRTKEHEISPAYFVKALCAGDVGTVQKALAIKRSRVTQVFNGMTPIMFVAEYGQQNIRAIVDVLLRAPSGELVANIAERIKHHEHALRGWQVGAVGARFGRIEFMQAVIANTAHFSADSRHQFIEGSGTAGITPLIAAVFSVLQDDDDGHRIQKIEYLLSQGANLTTTMKKKGDKRSGWDALAFAIELGDDKAVACLLNYAKQHQLLNDLRENREVYQRALAGNAQDIVEKLQDVTEEVNFIKALQVRYHSLQQNKNKIRSLLMQNRFILALPSLVTQEAERAVESPTFSLFAPFMGATSAFFAPRPRELAPSGQNSAIISADKMVKFSQIYKPLSQVGDTEVRVDSQHQLSMTVAPVTNGTRKKY